MLTPLGSGGRRPSRRRRARVLLVLVVVVVLLATAAGAWWWFTQRPDSSGPGAAGPTRVCVTPTPRTPTKLPDPADVKVSVLNGTSRAGLAIDTADTLVLRGFDVTAIGNAPRPVASGVAVVLFGPKASAEAVQLASYFPGATLQRQDGRTSTVVQVDLGPSFTKVATPAQARREARRIELPPLPPRCHITRPSTHTS